MKRFMPAIIILILMFVPGIGVSEEAAKMEFPETLTIKGYMSNDSEDSPYVMELVPGSLATKAVVVRAVKSQQILFTLMDHDFLKTEAGKTLQKKLAEEKPGAMMESDLPLGSPRATLENGPGEDDLGLQIEVYGDNAPVDGDEGLILMGAEIDLSNFELSWRPVRERDGNMLGHHFCLRSGSCEKQCGDFSKRYFVFNQAECHFTGHKPVGGHTN